MAQLVKNQPAMQETQVQHLGRECLMEKEMATDSTILAWKSDGQRKKEPRRLQSMGLLESYEI